MLTPAYVNLPAEAGGVAPHVLVGVAEAVAVAAVEDASAVGTH